MSKLKFKCCPNCKTIISDKYWDEHVEKCYKHIQKDKKNEGEKRIRSE